MGMNQYITEDKLPLSETTVKLCRNFGFSRSGDTILKREKIFDRITESAMRVSEMFHRIEEQKILENLTDDELKRLKKSINDEQKRRKNEKK